MAAARMVYVVGIVVLLGIMAVVVLYGYSDYTRPLPFSCGDYGSPSLAPPECHRINIAFFVVPLALLGSAVGLLWRKLGK